MCALFSLFYKVDGESSVIDKLELSKEEEEFIDYEIALSEEYYVKKVQRDLSARRDLS